MANIVINNYCNLQCPYCFANQYMTEEEKQSITTEQLSRILEFLGRSSHRRIGIIGGEPTIHPNFSSVLKQVTDFCNPRNIYCTVFSNGIKLGDYAELFKDKVNCLINVNHPDVIGTKNWKSIINSLDELEKHSNLNNANLGVNLYNTLKDYDFIFELTRKYKKEFIRVSYAAPACKFSNSGKDDYYSEAKEIFLPFVQKAYNEGVRIDLECNHIPRCYFTEEELDFLASINITKFFDLCGPATDITPDFKVTACFGAYELFSLENFNDIEEFENYVYLNKIQSLIEKNTDGKCKDCIKHKNLSCQGGCLVFATR